MMKNGKKYSVTMMRWDPQKKTYEAVLVIHSVKDAEIRYKTALDANDETLINEACAVLNAIREKAGQPIPVC